MQAVSAQPLHDLQAYDFPCNGRRPQLVGTWKERVLSVRPRRVERPFVFWCACTLSITRSVMKEAKISFERDVVHWTGSEVMEVLGTRGLLVNNNNNT